MVQASGLRVRALGLGSLGLGFKARGLGLRVQNSGLPLSEAVCYRVWSEPFTPDSARAIETASVVKLTVAT